MTSTKPSPSSISFRTLAPAATILALLGGCANAQREAYFQSRSAVVQPHAGSGSARMAMWPVTPWGRSTLAVAQRESDGTPILPRPAEGNSPR